MTFPSNGRLRLLHLGLGSFHRAHQAVYMHRLLQAGDARWQLAGANLRPDMADTLAALQRQGGAYTLETVSPQGARRLERITAITEVVPFEPTLARVLALGADPATRIVSFTVTEAGYALDHEGRLDFGHEDVANDLAGRPPRSIYGAVAALLRRRRALDAGPVTLLNCDNLRHNGDRFRANLRAFIGLADDAEFLAWVDANTTCPNAMVDRITPRPTPEAMARIRELAGWDDQAPLMAESFIQWVIEDRFANGRPAWETVGVEMTDDVQPYEEAKIRILNASHSAIAWAGTLRGLSYIHEGVRDPAIRGIAADYVTDDVIPCLARAGAPSPVDLPAYRDVVLDRFSNEAIADTNQRVAADGFAKIPGFILPTLRERLARGESIAAAARLPALFLTFLQRWHRGRLPFAYQDQAMLPERAHALCEAADPLAAFVAEASLWNELAGSAALKDAIAAARMDLHELLGDAAMS
ncbi:MAG TPA: D-arabinitol 4-dehydrogenase [Burkholderiaceae bacterium]|jgi:D-arabinitol 4-dehydrogenase|nr:D-arabinitol 4-dehydrogenase [Burkholderiaceae bacterium]